MSDDTTEKLKDNRRLDQLLTLVQGIDERLKVLEQKVDERLYDTRPLWEGVQTQLTELRAEVEKGFRQMNRQLDVLAGSVVRLDANQRDLEARINDVESKVS
jgi:chromosome segregation ATPase